MNTIKFEKQHTKLVAHRGLSGLEKENTASAFVAAANRSYWGIETDVRKTRDGEFVVIHDDTTGRVAGDNISVEDTDLSALRELILYNSDFAFPGGCSGELGDKDRFDLRIPTFGEYLGLCAKYEKTAVVELKGPFSIQDLRKIISQVSDKNYLDHTIFISFDLSLLIHTRGLLPNQPLQYLTDQCIDIVQSALLRYRLDLDIAYQALTEELVHTLHSQKIKVNCWTCDDTKSAECLASWGVDFITTNILE